MMMGSVPRSRSSTMIVVPVPQLTLYAKTNDENDDEEVCCC